MSQFHTFFSAEPTIAQITNNFQKRIKGLKSEVKTANSSPLVVNLVIKFPRWGEWIEEYVHNFTLGANMSGVEMSLALRNMGELLTLLSSEEGIEKIITCKKKGAGPTDPTGPTDPLAQYFPFTFMLEDLHRGIHRGKWTFWKWEKDGWTRTDTNYRVQ